MMLCKKILMTMSIDLIQIQMIIFIMIFLKIAVMFPKMTLMLIATKTLHTTTILQPPTYHSKSTAPMMYSLKASYSQSSGLCQTIYTTQASYIHMSAPQSYCLTHQYYLYSCFLIFFYNQRPFLYQNWYVYYCHLLELP